MAKSRINSIFLYLFKILPFIAFSFLMLTGYELFKNSYQINFKNQALTSSEIEVIQTLEKIESTLNHMAELQKNIGQEPVARQIIKYNHYSDAFNESVLSISQLSYLKDQSELKNKLIRANNFSYQYVDSIKQQIATQKKLPEIELNIYLKNYSENKSEIKKKSDHLYFNSETNLFLIGLICFSICSIVFFSLYHHIDQKQKNDLFQTESKLETFLNIINNMSEGVIVTNQYGFFTYYNQSALDIIGSNIKDIHYQSSLDLLGFHNADLNKIEKENLPFYLALQKTITDDQEIFVKNERNPEGIYVTASSGYFVNQRGETAGSVVVMKNITHKKLLEALWLKEKEAAIDGSKKKSDFLASMSHEIRTPMNGIIGLTTLLNETTLNSEQKDYVGTVHRSAHALLALINDILDHSKIEAGKVDLVTENFNLKLLIKDILENFKFICAEKNIQIISNYPENLGEYFMADGHRIRQILMNLIGNAVKFTSHGHVELRLCCKQNENQTEIKFEIIDTGAGMEPHEVERLFQRFFQTKSGLKFGGTGLGLSISKQLVDLMSGSIGVNSTVNVGSTFWFKLNLDAGAAPIAQISQQTISTLENAFSGRILVAEDNLVNQKVASQYLKKLGFIVDLAHNGAEAVALFKKSTYDLIFMDCQMPIMTGYQATKEILELQSDKSMCVPIVALTAEGTSGEKIKCFTAGMNDFLNKPLVFEELAKLLKKYFAVTTSIGPLPSEIFKLSELMVGDQLLLEVLLDDYQATTPELIQKMKVALSYQNQTELSNAAHTLKSASATLGANQVSKICEKLEIFSTPIDINAAQQLITQLELEYTKSISAIQKTVFTIKNQQKASA